MEYIKKLFTGILYGAGFALGVFLLTYFMPAEFTYPNNRTFISSSENEPSEQDALRESKRLAKENIKIEDRGYNMGHSGPEYLASLTNNSGFDFTWVSPMVDLFDADGIFIYQCSGLSINPLNSGDTRNLKITCDGINRSIVDNISSYTLFIDRAH